jgi:LmbE family N-acetylglucosaminyl deacetylase
MPSSISQFVRRYVRGLRRANTYPILLPHFTVTDGGVQRLDGAFDACSPRQIAALRQCDGTRTFAQVALASGVPRSHLIRFHDEGVIILWTRPVPPGEGDPSAVTTIIISPHPDDAALSVFHSMLRSDTLVVNVFSQVAWWRLPTATSERVQHIRHEEERLVSRLTGSPLRMLDLPEALLRGYPMDQVFGAAVTERDRTVRATLSRNVADLARAHPIARWLLPLAVGNHVDHVIARDETLAALQQAGVPADRIRFFEDLPYAADASGIPDFSEQVPDRRLRLSSKREIRQGKLECLRVYWSQLTWGQILNVQEYAKRVGGGTPVERTWELLP